MVRARHSTANGEPARGKDDSPRRTPKVTVLTLTYNRRHTLARVFESLCSQTYFDFEWLVIDDGSEDGTAATVESWRRSIPGFDIRYEWQPNAGKHIAHNRGVALARGEFCSIIDSDDWYVPTALERLVNHWEALPLEERPKYANVECLCMYVDGTLVGSLFLGTCSTVTISKSGLFASEPAIQGDLPNGRPEEIPVPRGVSAGVCARIACLGSDRAELPLAVCQRGGRLHRVSGGRPEQPPVDGSLRRSRPVGTGLCSAARNEAATSRHGGTQERGELHAVFAPWPCPAANSISRTPARTLYLLTAPAGVALYVRDRWNMRDWGWLPRRGGTRR